MDGAESREVCGTCGGSGEKPPAWVAESHKDVGGPPIEFGPKFWEGIEEKTDAVEAEKLWTHAAMLALVVALFVAYWGVAVALRFLAGG